jgi:hypothetical protein
MKKIVLMIVGLILFTFTTVYAAVLINGTNIRGNIDKAGQVSGEVPTFTVTDNTTLTKALHTENAFVFVDNVSRAIVLPEVVASSPNDNQVLAGSIYCVQMWGANILRVVPNANDGIRLDGTSTRGANGTALAATAAAGSQICVFADSDAGWSTTSKAGTWALE